MVLSYLILVLPADKTQAPSKTTRTTKFLSFLYPDSYHPTGVYTACDSTRGEVCSSVGGDQSELSLKGCQARRNPIQYQYRSTTGRAGRLLGTAAVSLTVVSAAAACQRPPPAPSYPFTPPTVPNTGQDRQMGCLGSLPREHSLGDEYQPVEEETASLPSWRHDVCCTRPFHCRLVCLAAGCFLSG